MESKITLQAIRTPEIREPWMLLHNAIPYRVEQDDTASTKFGSTDLSKRLWPRAAIDGGINELAAAVIQWHADSPG